MLLGEPAASYTDFETGQCTITVFLKARPSASVPWRGEIKSGLKKISECGLNTAPAKVGLARVRAEDWAESWKRHFKPIEIGNSLLVLPSWSSRRACPGQQKVILDPGLSFGTGHHATTAFCLRQVVRGRRRGALSLLDIGTGSGILSIAAAKLGYARVHAFDYDPESIRVARQNARANEVGRAIRLWQQDIKALPGQAEPKYDVVCANLVANLLIEERARIVDRLLAPGGLLALAGILKSEFHEVQGAYEGCGLRLLASETRNEWRSGAFVWNG